MRVAIIGRTEVLYDTAILLKDKGFEIPLIVTSKEAPEYLRKAADFKELAHQFGSEFIYTPKINSPDVIEKIKSVGHIDIAVSINYSGVISENVIDIFSKGILNVHGGDLPKYRGNACQAWAIINGENRVGLCVHKMIGGELDSGNIILKEYLPIDINTKVGKVLDWIRLVTPDMIYRSVRLLKENENYVFEVQSKKVEDALRCYPRTQDDNKINWTLSNVEVLRLINASSEPYSGAFAEFEGSPIIIWDAELYNDDEIYSATPGQVAEINSEQGYVIVITGKGKLKILVMDCLEEALLM